MTAASPPHKRTGLVLPWVESSSLIHSSLGTVPKPQGKSWGDLVGGFDGVDWTRSNNLVNVDDVAAVLSYVANKPGKPHITRVDIAGASPTFTDFIVNATDLLLELKAFQGDSYPPLPFVAEGYPANGDLTQCP